MYIKRVLKIWNCQLDLSTSTSYLVLWDVILMVSPLNSYVFWNQHIANGEKTLFPFLKKLYFSFIEKLKHYKKSGSTTNSNQYEVSISWNMQNKKIIHERKMNQHTKSLLKIRDEPIHKHKSHSRKRWTNTHKKNVYEKIQPTQNNWCSFWKILEKVNVPNQHAIFRESVENQHVSRVFMDHLYPPKYAIVSYPLNVSNFFQRCPKFQFSTIRWSNKKIDRFRTVK